MNLLNTILSDMKYNSLTKYPSIPTYHTMKEGILLDSITNRLIDSNTKVYITEKIDGTNTRILVYNNDYIIGSREDWFYAKGDRVFPSSVKGFAFISKVAEQILATKKLKPNTLYCIYGELYGTDIQKTWTHYTSSKDSFDYRIFDVWSMGKSAFSEMSDNITANDASNWRENNSQPWLNVEELEDLCKNIDCERVPYQKTDILLNIPITKLGAFEYLMNYRITGINLDDSDKKCKDGEGIVVRTSDRKYIVKLRFEDYIKTFRKTGVKF